LQKLPFGFDLDVGLAITPVFGVGVVGVRRHQIFDADGRIGLGRGCDDLAPDGVAELGIGADIRHR